MVVAVNPRSFHRRRHAQRRSFLMFIWVVHSSRFPQKKGASSRPIFCSTNSHLFLRFKRIIRNAKLSEIGWRRPKPDNRDRHRPRIEDEWSAIRKLSLHGVLILKPHIYDAM